MNSIILSSEAQGLAKVMVGVIIGLIIGLFSVISNLRKKYKSKKTDFEDVTKEETDKIIDKNS